MLSIVSNRKSSVIPFVFLRENKLSCSSVNDLWAKIDDVQDTRFFANEGPWKTRMAMVLTAALLAVEEDDEAVVILQPEKASLSVDPLIEMAFRNAVDVARTGKNVQIVRAKEATLQEHPETARAIEGLQHAFHVDVRAETGFDDYEPTGSIVLRADRFLVEAAILCPTLFRMVSDSVWLGYAEVLHFEDDVVALARESFNEAFWCKTENRAIVTISSGQPHAAAEFEPAAQSPVAVGANTR